MGTLVFSGTFVGTLYVKVCHTYHVLADRRTRLSNQIITIFHSAFIHTC